MTPPTPPRPRLRRPGRSTIIGLVALAVMGALAAGCGASLSDIVGSTSTTQNPVGLPGSGTATSTPPLSGEVAVAFPVVGCVNAFGVPLPNQGWKPSILLAPIPTSLVGKVEFFTDGTHTVVGPEGWSCSEWAPSPGTTGLAVYPANSPAPSAPAQAGDDGIFASFDTTGRTSGMATVCPFFSIPQWQQQQASCTGSPPTGEVSAMPTPDVASVTDPSGVTGTLQGSGGPHPVTGVVIFPQVMPAVTNGSPVSIAVESCSLVAVSLCPTVLSDFEVREFPVPTARG